MEARALYRTVGKEGRGEYKEKGSKFLGFVWNVSDEDQVRERLDSLRSEFHDARHHCYAYILGHDGSRYRANDDGEPSHSAGDPILGQLKARELTDVLCVVVRYFGGTKLGVSGLINAYRTAASEALDNAILENREISRELVLTYPYDSTSEVMRLVDEFSLEIIDQEFTMECRLRAAVNVSWKDLLAEKVELLRSTGTEVTLVFS